MPACTRNGCKKEFSLEQNDDGDCVYHSGAPVFHEGLKSWSCCSDVNKPELDFDEFMKIKGCQTGKHTTERPKPVAQNQQSPAPTNVRITETSDGTEVFTTGALNKLTISEPSTTNNAKARAASPAPPPVEEEDDMTTEVKPGTPCKHKGCNAEFISNEESRHGDGKNAICTYHPSLPIFHEGSKGFLCCKRRVLEFDEFLKIEGCKKGRHLFVVKKPETQEEVVTNCRIDHYQTPQNVNVSVFAKQTDKAKSVVKFEEEQLHLDLFFSGTKRFRRSIPLYGPIIPEDSTFTIMGTKVELSLKKKDARSWNLLEKTDVDIGAFNLTFGVGGRTGTIGARELILDENNAPKVYV